jgi:hypothetical protein
MYELWTVSSIDGEIKPLFLEDRGDFDDLYIKFKERHNTIITDTKGNIKESHFKI